VPETIQDSPSKNDRKAQFQEKKKLIEEKGSSKDW
jgi:hypothetical protein